MTNSPISLRLTPQVLPHYAHEAMHHSNNRHSKGERAAVTAYHFQAANSEEHQTWVGALQSVMGEEAEEERRQAMTAALDDGLMDAAKKGKKGGKKEPTAKKGGKKGDGGGLEALAAVTGEMEEILREGRVGISVESRAGQVTWADHWLVLKADGSLLAYTMLDKNRVEAAQAEGQKGKGKRKVVISNAPAAAIAGGGGAGPSSANGAAVEPEASAALANLERPPPGSKKGSTLLGLGRPEKAKGSGKKVGGIFSRRKQLKSARGLPAPGPGRKLSRKESKKAAAAAAAAGGGDAGAAPVAQRRGSKVPIAAGAAAGAAAGGKGAGAQVTLESDCTPVCRILLEGVSEVERSQGPCFYDFAIDVSVDKDHIRQMGSQGRGKEGGADGERETMLATTLEGSAAGLRFMPSAGQRDMQAWLGSLQTTLALAQRNKLPRDEMVCTMCQVVIPPHAPHPTPPSSRMMHRPPIPSHPILPPSMCQCLLKIKACTLGDAYVEGRKLSKVASSIGGSSKNLLGGSSKDLLGSNRDVAAAGLGSTKNMAADDAAEARRVAAMTKAGVLKTGQHRLFVLLAKHELPDGGEEVEEHYELYAFKSAAEAAELSMGAVVSLDGIEKVGLTMVNGAPLLTLATIDGELAMQCDKKSWESVATLYHHLDRIRMGQDPWHDMPEASVAAALRPSQLALASAGDLLGDSAEGVEGASNANARLSSGGESSGGAGSLAGLKSSGSLKSQGSSMESLSLSPAKLLEDSMLQRGVRERLVPAEGVGVVAGAVLSIQESKADGTITWTSRYVELHTDGFLRWKEPSTDNKRKTRQSIDEGTKAEKAADGVKQSRAISEARWFTPPPSTPPSAPMTHRPHAPLHPTTYRPPIPSHPIPSYPPFPSHPPISATRAREWRDCVDATHGLGCWPLGGHGWRRLQLVVPERSVTLASEDDALLEEWRQLLHDVGKGKRVREVHRGWVEKKNEMSDRWQHRYLVLLSTHELLVLQKENATQPKHIVDLATLVDVRASDEYEEDGYDFAFIIETAKGKGARVGGSTGSVGSVGRSDDGADKVVVETTTLCVCVDDEEQRTQWIEQLRRAAPDRAHRVTDHPGEKVEVADNKHRKGSVSFGLPRALGGGTAEVKPDFFASSTKTASGRFYMCDERGRLVHAKRADRHATRARYNSMVKVASLQCHSWPPRANQTASEGLTLPSTLVRSSPATQISPRGRPSRHFRCV